MISPRLPQNLSFRVETMFPGGRVGVVKPDANGIYKGLPMMVLNEETQQRTFYDPQSVVDQITNPAARFNITLKQGKAWGEYGHPTFFGLSDNDKLARLVHVEEKNASHLFTSIYTDAQSANGTMVVRGDIKPTGPFGNTLKDSLDDPCVNTAFSLRAFVDTRMKPDGQRYRTVKSLVTFDTVGASGYRTTDKAHAIGLESFGGDNHHEFDINILENGNLKIDQIALETFSNTELNEIFGVSSVSKIVQSITIVKPDPTLMEKFPNLYAKGIFNDFFNETR